MSFVGKYRISLRSALHQPGNRARKFREYSVSRLLDAQVTRHYFSLRQLQSVVTCRCGTTSCMASSPDRVVDLRYKVSPSNNFPTCCPYFLLLLVCCNDTLETFTQRGVFVLVPANALHHRSGGQIGRFHFHESLSGVCGQLLVSASLPVLIVALGSA